MARKVFSKEEREKTYVPGVVVEWRYSTPYWLRAVIVRPAERDPYTDKWRIVARSQETHGTIRRDDLVYLGRADHTRLAGSTVTTTAP